MLNIPMLLRSGPGLVEGVQAYSSELPVMASEVGVAVAKVEAWEVAVVQVALLMVLKACLLEQPDDAMAKVALLEKAREVAVVFLVHRLLKPIGMRMSLTRIDLEMASGNLVQGGNFRRNAHKRIQSFPIRVD